MAQFKRIESTVGLCLRTRAKSRGSFKMDQAVNFVPTYQAQKKSRFSAAWSLVRLRLDMFNEAPGWRVTGSPEE
jgi:hypothetical protein